jgi:hypothetical protein
MRQTLKIGFVVLVVAALVTSGLALAQVDDESTADTAPAPSRFVFEQLAPLVEDGTLTEAEAGAVADVLAQGMGRFGHRRTPGPGLEAIGEFLGLTVAELRTALQDGSTLAAVAEVNESSAQELIEFLVDEAEVRLDEAVAAGHIDEAEKAERLAEITERTTDRVNSEFEFRGPGRGRGGRGPGGPGFGGSAGPGPCLDAPQGGEGTDI